MRPQPPEPPRPTPQPFEPRVVTAPPLRLDPATVAAFERAHEALTATPDAPVDRPLGGPAHLFLRWLAEDKGYLLHGSNQPDIEVFTPRDQTDAAQRHVRAVFATADGLWPMYFAIVDRSRPRVSLNNACWLTDGGERRYYFAVDDQTVRDGGFVPGTVYVLPRAGFARCVGLDGAPTEEWLCPIPVRPAGRVRVTPAEFPYLDDITGYDATPAFRAVELVGAVERAATATSVGDTGVVFVLGPAAVPDARELVATLPALQLHDVSATVADAGGEGCELRISGPAASLALLRSWGERAAISPDSSRGA